jgi:hypothetical protein
MANMFVLPTSETCMDGKDHWFQTFAFGLFDTDGVRFLTASIPPNAINWCRECGTYNKGTPQNPSLPVYPKVYLYLKEFLLNKKKAGFGKRLHMPDENTCINGEKHHFKKVYEKVISKVAKNDKETRVIEVCDLCGTLTVSKYKYSPGVLGTSNKDKISRVRRRIYANDSSSIRLNYALIPDIYLKLEKSVPECKLDYQQNNFWWYASFYEAGSWMEDVNTSPISLVTKPKVEKVESTWAPSASSEHWTS